MKTLQIGDLWFPEAPGGLARMFYELSQHLPHAGIDFQGLVIGSPQIAEQTSGKISAVADPSLTTLSRLKAMRRSFSRLERTYRPDVVVAHFALNALPVLDKSFHRPFVFHFHGPWHAESIVEEGSPNLSTRVKALAETIVYRKADRCIVLSNAFGQMLQEKFGVASDRIRVVPGGVDATRFDTGLSKRQARERLGWPTDRPIVLCVRRLVRRMGLENLIRAVHLARLSIPDILLVIAGSGPICDELIAMIEQLELTQHIRLLGFVPDKLLALHYAGADLSIVPTVALEGFGLITVESLAAGTPVLVTPVGGLPETVKTLSESLVLSGAGENAIREGIVDALIGRLPLPDSNTCMRYARETFDWAVIAPRIAGVYREVTSCVALGSPQNRQMQSA
jgi:glycosyltransferase involved in cell wall biosynthesis